MTTHLAGVVLAAGAGRRAGGPKALRRSPDGRAWIDIAATALREAGCDQVFVVLGDEAQKALGLVPMWAMPVVARDWAEGQSASLRAALRAAGTTPAEALLVTLVDLPEQTPDAARRVAAAASGASSLARATFDGQPGHPVLIGRDHWSPLRETLAGDEGARAYLASHEVELVDCTDLGGGTDADSEPSHH